MEAKTLKMWIAGAALLVLVAVGIMWKVSSSRSMGPRPGIDVPWRGM